MRLTVAQSRAARALLDWTRTQLAEAASVGIMTVNRFESGQQIADGSRTKLQTAFTAAGISFIAAGETSSDGGEGVRLTPNQSKPRISVGDLPPNLC